MSALDSESSTEVLAAFKSAWTATTREYIQRRLNSERCLQAYLFFHLKRKLSSDYNIFVEATIRIPKEIGTNTEEKRVAVDMLVCKGKTVYAAIELKFSPKGQSRLAGIKKDILSLSDIRKRRSKSDRVRIELPRYRNSASELMSLNIHSTRKLIFAAFGKVDGSRLNKDIFWASHIPKEGRWKSASECPPQFCVALAQTDNQGGAYPIFFGPPFDRQTGYKRKAETSGEDA